MATQPLTTYLNDHLAGSVAALELLEHLIERHADMPWAGSLTELRGEIEEDQTALRDLLQRLGEAESATKKTLGWLSEKLGVARRTLSPGYEPELAMLEDFEALALGIQGKLGLWRALAIVAPAPPALRGLDLGTPAAARAESVRTCGGAAPRRGKSGSRGSVLRHGRDRNEGGPGLSRLNDSVDLRPLPAVPFPGVVVRTGDAVRIRADATVEDGPLPRRIVGHRVPPALTRRGSRLCQFFPARAVPCPEILEDLIASAAAVNNYQTQTQGSWLEEATK